MGTVVIDTQGSVVWGTIPALIPRPPGADSVSFVLTAPVFGKWIALWEALDSSGTQVQHWTNDENGLDGVTYSNTFTFSPTAVDDHPFIWQGQGNQQTGNWTCRSTYHVPDALVEPCAYGSQIKASMPVVATIDNAIVGAALALIPSSFWGDVLGWFLGFTLDVDVLCAGLPPTVLQITTSMLINPGHGGLDLLYATLWPYYCECIPGTPTPPRPALPSPTKPPGYPDPKTYPPNPTNPCLDISDVRRMLDQLLLLVQRDLELDKAVQRFDVPFGTIAGPTHAGLTGSGTIAVERLVGVLVTWTAGDPTAVWEGEPPYFKDLGWLSANDGGAMLMETRITRQQQIWMPKHMALATQLGYFAKNNIELAIQELLPEP